MATAEATFTEPVEPELTEVVLTLNPEEAQYLYDLLGSVAGLGHYRELNDNINLALARAGKLNYTRLNSDDFPFTRESRICVKRPS